MDCDPSCRVHCDLGIIYSEVAAVIRLNRSYQNGTFRNCLVRSVPVDMFPSVAVKRVCRGLRSLIAAEEERWMGLNIQ